jgi:formamidopyrimidine-DNA glycosylase
MPELPEVQALVAFLTERAVGHVVARVDIAAISALKTFDPSPASLVGLEIRGVSRHGKFLDLDVDGLHLVVHLARAGWLQWKDSLPTAPPKPSTKSLIALRLHLDDGSGFDLTEAGTRKGLAVYVVRSIDQVPGIGRLGIDAASPELTVDALAALLAQHRAQLKGVLTDQTIIAGIGNAYSDEILHFARLSPFKMAAKLTGDEVARLHAAIKIVLADALQRSLGLRAAELKGEKRTGMAVHARTGEPCPDCGDTVREVSFADSSLQYCPTCQTGGKPLADRRLSKLLK